jgi:hypothetical protein
MHVPNFRGDPTERTEILVAYDSDFLYVAGRLYDKEPSKIQAPSKKRDELKFSNDWFGIIIDTFNDNENALAFFTNPCGLRLDMTIFNDAKEMSQNRMSTNSSWNTFWDVATTQNSDGWFAEMRIPFTSLRFQEKDGRVVMSLITWRWIARKSECVIFPDISPKWGFWSPFKPSQAQEALFDGINSQKPLYIAPYVLGGMGQTFELNDAETAYIRDDKFEHEAGLDIKYGLTSNLTLDITLNTDFAQVEADDEQINLTRFSLFFPEKRLFFQERSGIFDISLGGTNRLFYSRQIGISDGNPVRIYGGARLVGRIGPWDLGLINLQTARFKDSPSENFGVFRIRRQVFNPYSYMGGMIATRIGTNGTYNLAYLLDGIFRLFGDDYLIFNWAQTFENDRKNDLFSLDPLRVRINWERRTLDGVGYNLDYAMSNADFNPRVGFESRDNYTRAGSRLWYGWFPREKSLILRHQALIDGSMFWSNERVLIESAEIGPGWELETKSGYFGRITAKLKYEDVPETFSLSDFADILKGQYTFFELATQLRSPRGKLLYTDFTFTAGTFYDGWKVSLGLTPFWSLSPRLELSGNYQLNQVEFPDRMKKFSAHIGRIRVLAMLSTKFSASAFIQYNSATDLVIANIRLRYNPREGNDLYVVYNEGLNTNRNHRESFLPLISTRTLMLKYTYTFNL